jgi:hypothetical protein
MTAILRLILIFVFTSSYSQNEIIDKTIENSAVTLKPEISAYNYLGLTIIPPDPNKIYAVEEIEKRPEFPGDEAALKAYIKENFKTPIDNGKKVSGTIFASFIIEKDGSISDIGILHDYGFGSGDEAIRVLEQMPKWIPAKNDSNSVRCMYAMPIICDGD